VQHDQGDLGVRRPLIAVRRLNDSHL
jgi:hypothetical protein